MPVARPKSSSQMILNFVGSPVRKLSSTTKDGAIVGRYEKDIMRTGKFKHPQQGWELNVTHKSLATYVRNFNAMKANGVDVEFVVNHDLKEGAKRVHGEVEKMRIDGNDLVATLAVRGAAGNELVERVKNVSVEIMEPFTDGEGHEYDPAITAVALVEKPIVTKQKPFRRVASVLNFAMAADEDAADENTEESDTMTLIQLIAKMTGKTLSTTEDAIDALKTYMASDNSDADPKVVAASVLANVDGDVISTVTEATNMKLDGLVQAGAITPDVRKKLGEVLLGTAEKPRILSLSTKAATALGVEVTTANAVIEALKDNKPKTATGVKTAAQSTGTTKNAGQEEPAGDEETDEALEAETKKWAQRTGGARTAAATT